MFSLLPLLKSSLTLSKVFSSVAAKGGVTTSVPLAVWWSPSFALVYASACTHTLAERVSESCYVGCMQQRISSQQQNGAQQ
jgi:hypothetical protein